MTPAAGGASVPAMADFHQTGVISTLHRLGGSNLEQQEREILSYSRERPIALVLPTLYSEIHGPALKGIVEELQSGSVPAAGRRESLRRRPTGGSTRTCAHCSRHRSLSRRLASPPSCGTGATRVRRACLDRLREERLQPGDRRQGPSHLAGLWLRARDAQVSRVVAVHDCDIVELRPGAPGPPLLPHRQPEPQLRVRQGLLQPRHRSPSRARHAPLHDAPPALDEVGAGLPAAARVSGVVSAIALAGEVLASRRTSCGRTGSPRIGASRWGCSPRSTATARPSAICQVELVENYDHKHQQLSESDRAHWGCTAWWSTSRAR